MFHLPDGYAKIQLRHFYNKKALFPGEGKRAHAFMKQNAKAIKIVFAPFRFPEDITVSVREAKRFPV